MKKKYNKDPIHIGNILETVIKKYQGQNDTGMTRIWDLWESSIEGQIAENAHPSAFKGQLLLVNVSSSVWVQQLQFLKADIIDKLNKAAGKEMVNEIRFKVGPV
jgi:predicted nucleic acid-binding Zn ribbon protein